MRVIAVYDPKLSDSGPRYEDNFLHWRPDRNFDLDTWSAPSTRWCSQRMGP